MPNLFETSFHRIHMGIPGTSQWITVFIRWQQSTWMWISAEKNDISIFTWWANHPASVQRPDSKCLPRVPHAMSYYCSKSPSMFVNTATKTNLINLLVLGPDVPVIITPLFSNHSNYEIYEIHWERGCTLEYCHSLSALKN